MSQIMIDLDGIWNQFFTQILKCKTEVSLADIKAQYLGKSGIITEILKNLKNREPEERVVLGKEINSLKKKILEKHSDCVLAFKKIKAKSMLQSNFIDTSYRSNIKDLGLVDAGYHPLTLIEREVEDFFFSMGFTILDGNYIEDAYHNFTALNIPDTHPARNNRDTFWFPDKIHCLRTQTSPIQIRAMESQKPPFRFVSLGKVFRNENVDASHEIAFHQIEAMVVDKDVSVGNMVSILNSLVCTILKIHCKTRLRTGYFPFVEPGFELDISCQICDQKGCSVCHHRGWVEFCGCGLVHPKVLEEGKIDPQIWSGFALGIGWDRLTMMRYGIDDIRHMHSGDLRFIRQFKSY